MSCVKSALCVSLADREANICSILVFCRVCVTKTLAGCNDTSTFSNVEACVAHHYHLNTLFAWKKADNATRWC
jgi:hypothetical protein